MAVVLAGGAISGGAFKVGGLRALDEMFAWRRTATGATVPFSLTDADVFVGLSAGSVLASVLAAGISPDEILRIVMGTSRIYEPFRAFDLMALNGGSVLGRLRSMVSAEENIFTNFLSGATDPAGVAAFGWKQTVWKMLGALPRGLPMGVFSTDRLAAYLRRNAARAGITDDFADEHARTGKELMLTAVDVNRGELIVFGHDEPYGKVPISSAVAASCALPGWYAPVRVKNPRAGEPYEKPFLDLVDGGVMRTANVRVAVEKGADLVICYNPFTRIRYERAGRSLVDHGPGALASQLLRILLGARLDTAKELLYRDETIDADVVFIEPAEDDYEFFRMNPMGRGTEERAAEHGYQTIRAGILANHGHLARIFATHGLHLHPLDQAGRSWAGTEVGEDELRESRSARNS